MEEQIRQAELEKELAQQVLMTNPDLHEIDID